MAKRKNHSVTLSGQQRRFLEAEVRSGRYPSASEVLREGLRQLEDRERFIAKSPADFRRKIAEGIASARAGRVVDGPSVFASIREMSRARRRKVA